MADRMNTHRFEHPLNERTRIYLRIEFLLRQMGQSADISEGFQHQLFFRALFDILDIFEQVPLKGDLGKDLEKQRQKLKSWLDVEGVDQAALTKLLGEIDDAHRTLMKSSRLGQELREDRFLSSIKQRFSIPGGSCCFDLPALHYWLHLPLNQRYKDAQRWMAHLLDMSQALSIWLKLTRESGHFQPKIARNGFFQGEADEASIIRLQIPMNYGVYPMISGHKNRFSIRFMSFERGQNCTEDIEFNLAIC